MNFESLEKKWQNAWEKEKIFESTPDKRKKFFGTFPIPYINGLSHIGHLYTIARVDAFARYKRLNNFNVLFPQAWHITGSPIVSAANRIKENEEKQIKILKDMGVSDKLIPKFKDPEYWVEFFAPEFKKDYSAMGLSIDWRRNFFTTSLNPYFDRFVKWQFNKLEQEGYLVKGSHPVVWDPKTNMPVGDHDRVKGEGETPQELLLFKFKWENKFIVTATLRPDTVLGITNLYANPNITYSELEVNGERWIVADSVLDKLNNQGFEVKKMGIVAGSEIIGQKVEFKDKKYLVLPANFLDDSYGTGIVHSVPSESADDLIALRDLQSNKEILKKYNLDEKEVNSISPIEVFETPGIKGLSAQHFLDQYKVDNQNERSKLDKIRKELYSLTFSKSKYNSLYETGFSENLVGKSILEGQEVIKKDLLEENLVSVFYELTGEVISRSLTKCNVKIVSDQWFLKYGDKEWKEKTHKALEKLKLFPEETREQFRYVIDWLNDWACAREFGLGTKLPVDEKWVIESLSDSTIYMAYYTIAHRINEFSLEEVNDEFFDFIFLNKGKGNSKAKELKEEFEYWYPLDFRNSGKDLVQNHLAFFLFNHVAIFPEKFWPVSIGVNGWVRVDGQKMSKSLGNMILLRDMAKEFGADASRITILNGGEKAEDPNWDTTFAKSLNNKLSQIREIIENNFGKNLKKEDTNKKIFESKYNTVLLESKEFMEQTLFRSAIQKILFGLGGLIKDYINKSEDSFDSEFFEKMSKSFAIMISPFAPHFAEELWESIGNKSFVCLQSWPEADESKIDEKFEKISQNVDKTVSDVLNVIKIVQDKEEKSPENVYLYVLPSELEFFSEKELSKRVGKSVKIFAVNDPKKIDPDNKSKKAKPGKPGIYLE